MKIRNQRKNNYLAFVSRKYAFRFTARSRKQHGWIASGNGKFM